MNQENYRLFATSCNVSSSILSPISISSYKITMGGSIRMVFALLRVPATSTPRSNNPEATRYPISEETKCCPMRSHFPVIDS